MERSFICTAGFIVGLVFPSTINALGLGTGGIAFGMGETALVTDWGFSGSAIFGGVPPFLAVATLGGSKGVREENKIFI